MATRTVPARAFDLVNAYHSSNCAPEELQVIFDYCAAASTSFEIAVVAYLIHFCEDEPLQIKVLNHLEELAS